MKIAANTRAIMKYANFIGFKKVRQRGTHMILKDQLNNTVTLKRHANKKTFSQYHLKELLHDLGSNFDEYIQYLNIKSTEYQKRESA
ncbi:type II toxin-antitoxin system HicA family toxin [uncultured Sulfuricurvum sp.]|uniref:type II toxin-antitoxin system HicA family toxin n=1 Tax=uncultured Sulfuricurvum sp. TaxID=430693 RepID=UPI00261413EB|nr:type II toxin-antitoxin system HicA family toxin [uncultured Sulfuricurvum sp.]